MILNKKFIKLFVVAIKIAIHKKQRWIPPFVGMMVFMFTTTVYAGAWTQNSGKLLLIQNSSFYYTDKFFDESGKKRQLNGYYQKYELNPYVEYGLSNDITIGANVFLDRSVQVDLQNATVAQNYGVGDSEFFIRKQLYKDSGFAVAIEPMIKLPSLTNSKKQPQIGSRYFDSAITISGGYGFSEHFIEVSGTYNHRFGTPNDQLKLAATAGFTVAENWQIMPQVFITKRTNRASLSSFTQSSSDDYNLTKLQLSAIYKINNNIAMQGAFFSNVAGRNVGDGDGVIISIHKSF